MFGMARCCSLASSPTCCSATRPKNVTNLNAGGRQNAMLRNVNAPLILDLSPPKQVQEADPPRRAYIPALPYHPCSARLSLLCQKIPAVSAGCFLARHAQLPGWGHLLGQHLRCQLALLGCQALVSRLQLRPPALLADWRRRRGPRTGRLAIVVTMPLRERLLSMRG